jgi:LacI family transcriptional regulator
MDRFRYEIEKSPAMSKHQPSSHAIQRSALRIAVLVDTSTMWGRDVIGGIQRYSREQGGWQLFVEPRGVEQRQRWLPNGWRGDGVIARVGFPELADQLENLRLPVVNVSGIELAGVDFPRVSADQCAAATMAAQHLLERGFRNFAYFSLVGIEYVTAHQKAFAKALADAGCVCPIFEAPPNLGAEPDWNLDIKRLGTWLAAQPKPLAAFVWNTSSARELLYACAAAGLSVPLEVAVLSGSDDDLFCEVAPVPISAVRLPASEIGYRAARELDIMIHDPDGAPPANVLISPLGVAVRQSTDTLAVEDPAVVKALQFIRSEATGPITVEDVARHAGLSRRGLEQKFSASLAFTPASEIRRIRVNRAIELLRLSNLPIGEIAGRAGFRSAEYMASAFRSQLGTTPSRYREDHFNVITGGRSESFRPHQTGDTPG